MLNSILQPSNIENSLTWKSVSSNSSCLDWTDRPFDAC